MSMPERPILSVGSDEWIKNEIHIMSDLIYANVKGFARKTRGELEWLKEHLAGILNGNQK